ncbi:hypothetical protein ADK86_26310 [Streptomyces sp. NRRL F-5755]|nr:hypothetical protein ADK86_26310 [Streptomyces sp. NRRL F-5755]
MPLFWLLGSPGAGEFAGASVQAATGVAALLWAVLSGPPQRAGMRDEARRTGAAVARGGGLAVPGIRRPGGRGDTSAIVEGTGSSTASGRGSTAVSGIDYSDDRPGQRPDEEGTDA